MIISSFFIFCLLLVPYSRSAPQNAIAIPRSITHCTRGSGDYSECLTSAIQELWHVFVKGIPELDITPRDPLILEKVEDTFATNDITALFLLRNFTIRGLLDTKFLRTRVNFTDNRIKLEVDQQIPHVHIECTHEINGSMSGLLVESQGYFNMSMINTTGTWTLDGHVENDRWIIEHFLSSNESAEKVKIYFTNLFKDNPELNGLILQLVNDSWETFFDSIKPIINVIGDAKSTAFFNEKVFSKLPISKVFH